MWLVIGDLLTLIMVTAIGFAAHGEADISFLPRFLAVILPLSGFWLMFAGAMRLFRVDVFLSLKHIWRVAAVACLAALPAAWLRSLMLSEPIAPAFVLVLAATSALGMTIWRTAYLMFRRGRERSRKL